MARSTRCPAETALDPDPAPDPAAAVLLLLLAQFPAATASKSKPSSSSSSASASSLYLPLLAALPSPDPASPTAAALLHGCGAKRIGSAQLWRRGRLLQHGSILLDPPRGLWRQLFGVDPPALPPLPLGQEDLILRLRRAAMRWLPLGAGAGPVGAEEEEVALEERPLSRGEWADIAAGLGRYRPLSLLELETSPEATMAWETWPRGRPEG